MGLHKDSVELLSSLFYTGVLIGSLAAGAITDRYGMFIL